MIKIKKNGQNEPKRRFQFKLGETYSNGIDEYEVIKITATQIQVRNKTNGEIIRRKVYGYTNEHISLGKGYVRASATDEMILWAKPIDELIDELGSDTQTIITDAEC